MRWIIRECFAKFPDKKNQMNRALGHLLCTYRLNWARRTSWGWWDDWDDTVLQTQDSKFGPWWSEAEHATSRSRRLPTIPTFTRGWGRHIFSFFQTAETGNQTPNSGVKGSGANHYPMAPAQVSRQFLCALTGCWQIRCTCHVTDCDAGKWYYSFVLSGLILWGASVTET